MPLMASGKLYNPADLFSAKSSPVPSDQEA